MRRFAPLAALLLLACSASSPHGSTPPPTGRVSPTAAATASPASTPTAPSTPSPTPASTPAPVAGAATVQCTTQPTATSLLVLGKVAGSSASVVRDITDLDNAHTDCTIQNAASAKFVSATRVAYTTAASDARTTARLLVTDLTNGASIQVVTFPSGFFGSGAYAFSADAANVTYLAGDGSGLAWHLIKGSADQVLATYPPVLGRGVDPDNDDLFLGFSPDGRFVALVQTFSSGSTADTMHLEVRSVADGSVAFGAEDATMATWAGTGSTLVYRTRAGAAYRWAGTSPLAIGASLRWIRPRPSPDGRFIVYTLRDETGLGHVYTLDLGANSPHEVSAGGRDSPSFLSTSLLWYQGERLCTAAEQCFLGPPVKNTGVTYINDVGGGNESGSRITEVDDIWPHLSSGRGT